MNMLGSPKIVRMPDITARITGGLMEGISLGRREWTLF
jgi:hypothetical protein